MAKMWVMFFTSLLLVSAMNFYAVIREPDLIDIDDIHEYPRETVKVEGVLTSFVIDPYGEQADRIDLQVREIDGHSVVEVRWLVDKDHPVPPVGTLVTVEGEVSEWNGRIWLASNGYGAIQCKQGGGGTGCMNIEYQSLQLVEVAMNPSKWVNESIRVDGYLSESMNPNVAYHSLSLMDNPAYGNADHLLYMQIEGRPLDWVESGSHVEVTGWIQYDQRSLRYRLLVQAMAVEVLNAGTTVLLDWDMDPQSLSYEVGKLVQIEASVEMGESGWNLVGPNVGDRLCMLPSPSDLENVTGGMNSVWTGRLIWSPDESAICLDRGHDAEVRNPVRNSIDALPLAEVASDPFRYAGGAFTFDGWVTGTISNDYPKGYVGDAETYYDRTTQLRIELIGGFEGYIEVGQSIRFNATVLWSESSGRIILEARSWTLGDLPYPNQLGWGDGYETWKWEIGNRVSIMGVVVMDDEGLQWIERSGTNERLCLIGDGTETSQQATAGEPIQWIGRLETTENFVENEMRFCLNVL